MNMLVMTDSFRYNSGNKDLRCRALKLLKTRLPSTSMLFLFPLRIYETACGTSVMPERRRQSRRGLISLTRAGYRTLSE